jgi:hypothetical protein
MTVCIWVPMCGWKFILDSISNPTRNRLHLYFFKKIFICINIKNKFYKLKNIILIYFRKKNI